MLLPDNLKISLPNSSHLTYPDVNNILNKCEKMVKGICFEIIIHRSKTDEKERHLIDIDPEDIEFARDVNTNMETLEERLNRIENLQGIYIELWGKTTKKIEELKKELKNTDYKIVLLKRKSDQIKNKVISEFSRPSSSCERYSAASTVLIDDNKSNCTSSNTSDGESPTKRKCIKDEYPKISSKSDDLVIIGPNGTEMNRSDYEQINWTEPASSTRKLLTFLFGDKVLATHSLTGNQSPAFRGRERAPKSKLDPCITSDIIYIVTLKCKVNPQLVRAAITTKCADTSKKFRRIGMKT